MIEARPRVMANFESKILNAPDKGAGQNDATKGTKPAEQNRQDMIKTANKRELEELKKTPRTIPVEPETVHSVFD